MIKRYADEEARQMRVPLVADNLFCMVFGELRAMQGTFTELNDVTIWMAAMELTQKVMECAAPEELMEDFVAEVSEGYSIPEGLKIPNEAWLVLMVSICQLSALRKKGTDGLIKLLLPYCRKHERFYPLLEKWDGKEQSMRTQLNKKVNVMTYALTEAKEQGNEKLLAGMDLFINVAMTLTAENMAQNLLALNLFNLQNGHILDEKILAMYAKMQEKTTPQPGNEFIFGNKNVANQGGAQLNGNMPMDMNQLMAMFNQMKALK